MRAKARQHKPGEMNKNEAAYAATARAAPARRRDRALSLRADEVPSGRPGLLHARLRGAATRRHASSSTRSSRDTARSSRTARAREAPFCFEDAKLKIRVAAAQFDEFGFLIVFPLKAGGWGRVEFGSRPIALSKATCARQEAHCGA